MFSFFKDVDVLNLEWKKNTEVGYIGNTSTIYGCKLYHYLNKVLYLITPVHFRFSSEVDLFQSMHIYIYIVIVQILSSRYLKYQTDTLILDGIYYANVLTDSPLANFVLTLESFCHGEFFSHASKNSYGKFISS